MNYKYNLKVEQNIAPEKVKDYSISNLPETVNLRNKISVTYDQGPLNSSIANALCYAYIYDNPTYMPSRLFLYYNGNINTGSTLSNGINALEKYGMCNETMWPYNVSRFSVKPSEEAYVEGLKDEIITADRVLQTMSSLKGCLASGYPFVVGIKIYSSFESDMVTKVGYVPMPYINSEELLGGHAFICVGYNNANGVWIMKNSRGASWGERGYFYLPFEYLTNLELCGDIWKITKVPLAPSNKNRLLKINENIKIFGYRKGM